jgi:DNA repair protein RecO (recombination protein O)
MSTSSIAKTEAIALRIAPFSNTSHVVTWLTPTHGRIATVIKGACRPKSPVFGQYDLGYLCELLFYERDHNGIHIVKECSTIDSRGHCRGNWQLTAAIGYLCHLASVATPDGAHAPDVYHLLEGTLNRVADRGTPGDRDTEPPPAVPLSPTLPAPSAPSDLSPLLFWFELQLLELLGIPPQLQRCTACHQSSLPSLTTFSARSGGAVCTACVSKGRTSANTPLPGDALAMLRRWQTAPTFEVLTTIAWTRPQQQQIRSLLGAFLIHHLDLAPECRSVAYSMLDTVTDSG